MVAETDDRRVVALVVALAAAAAIVAARLARLLVTAPAARHAAAARPCGGGSRPCGRAARPSLPGARRPGCSASALGSWRCRLRPCGRRIASGLGPCGALASTRSACARRGPCGRRRRARPRPPPRAAESAGRSASRSPATYLRSSEVAMVIDGAGQPGAAGAADAVDVVLGVGGHVEIEDVADRRDVEAARRHVAGDQQRDACPCGNRRASPCGRAGPCRHAARRR